MKRVVITGLGCITPIGLTVPAFEQSLFAGHSGIAPFGPLPETGEQGIDIRLDGFGVADLTTFAEQIQKAE